MEQTVQNVLNLKGDIMSENKQYAPVEAPKSGGSVTFIRASKLAEAGTLGVIAEGIYLGTVPNPLEESRLDFKIETSSGLVIINTTSSLARQMALVNVGEGVRISYNGQSVMKSGKAKGKKTHNFLVERETSN